MPHIKIQFIRLSVMRQFDLIRHSNLRTRWFLFRLADVWIKILWVERFRTVCEKDEKAWAGTDVTGRLPYFKGSCFHMHYASKRVEKTVCITTWFTCTLFYRLILCRWRFVAWTHNVNFRQRFIFEDFPNFV